MPFSCKYHNTLYIIRQYFCDLWTSNPVVWNLGFYVTILGKLDPHSPRAHFRLGREMVNMKNKKQSGKDPQILKQCMRVYYME